MLKIKCNDFNYLSVHQTYIENSVRNSVYIYTVICNIIRYTDQKAINE